jgi:hypothetical protein
MGEAGQIAQHHAEAVIQRHGNAQPVLGREAHAFANEKAVVEDVAVRQRRALGKARGAAGELDIDGIVVAERGRNRIDALIRTGSLRHQLRKAQHAGLFGVQIRRT